jgi:hypothetical protein
VKLEMESGGDKENDPSPSALKALKTNCPYPGRQRSYENMGEAREIYTIKVGKASLREYVIPATNKHRFEVKNGTRVVYEGESYQEAKSMYRELSEERTKPAEMPTEVISPRPKRRLVRLRTAYADAS